MDEVSLLGDAIVVIAPWLYVQRVIVVSFLAQKFNFGAAPDAGQVFSHMSGTREKTKVVPR